jgi:hypothetical protein
VAVQIEGKPHPGLVVVASTYMQENRENRAPVTLIKLSWGGRRQGAGRKRLNAAACGTYPTRGNASSATQSNVRIMIIPPSARPFGLFANAIVYNVNITQRLVSSRQLVCALIV